MSESRYQLDVGHLANGLYSIRIQNKKTGNTLTQHPVLD